MAQIRVGVVGAGYIGERHVVAWRRLGAEVHLHSRSPHRRTGMAQRHAATPHGSLHSLLDAVEMVDVCTPTDTHAAITSAAAAAGRHVVCEKPLARTLDTAAAMLDACRAAGVGLYPAHVVRYYPAYAAARSVTQAGRYGPPVALRLRRAGAVPEWAEWLHQPDRSGGILVIHDFDAARWFAGEVAEVFACLSRTGLPDGSAAPAEARVVLRHRSGAVSHVSGSWAAPGTPFRTSFEVAMRSGIVWQDSSHGDRLESTANLPAPAWHATDDPIAAQLAEFRDAIRGGPPPRVTAEDGLVAVDIALAALKSAHTGRPVTPATHP